MTLEKEISILQSLANGVDPSTGEVFPSELKKQGLIED